MNFSLFLFVCLEHKNKQTNNDVICGFFFCSLSSVYMCVKNILIRIQIFYCSQIYMCVCRVMYFFSCYCCCCFVHYTNLIVCLSLLKNLIITNSKLYIFIRWLYFMITDSQYTTTTTTNIQVLIFLYLSRLMYTCRIIRMNNIFFLFHLVLCHRKRIVIIVIVIHECFVRFFLLLLFRCE